MLPMGTRIQLTDSDGRHLCTVHRKALGTNPVYDISDSNGSQLGSVKRTAAKLKGSTIMYSPTRKELLKATGNIVKWEFVISGPKKKDRIIATIRKAGCLERTLSSRANPEERYFIYIENLGTDRLLLLAYAIATTDATCNV